VTASLTHRGRERGRSLGPVDDDRPVGREEDRLADASEEGLPDRSPRSNADGYRVGVVGCGGRDDRVCWLTDV